MHYQSPSLVSFLAHPSSIHLSSPAFWCPCCLISLPSSLDVSVPFRTHNLDLISINVPPSSLAPIVFFVKCVEDPRSMLKFNVQPLSLHVCVDDVVEGVGQRWLEGTECCGAWYMEARRFWSLSNGFRLTHLQLVSSLLCLFSFS